MSLVGSLEDLGLGDILQIVSLARKSGVLSLKWQEVRGKIIFLDGLVVAALESGVNYDLGRQAVEKGIITEKQLQETTDIISREGENKTLKEILTSKFNVNQADIEEAIKEKIEEVTFSFFNWPEGNFSFELTEVEPEIRKLKRPWKDFILAKGLSPQYLAMEGTRQHDERRRVEEESPVGPVAPPVKAEEKPPASPVEPPVQETSTFETRDSVPSEQEFTSVSDFVKEVEKREQTAAEETPEMPAPEEEPPKEQPEEAPEGINLVLVDDDPLLIESLQHHLRPKGYRLHSATSSQDAHGKYDELRAQGTQFVILADLIMPSQEEGNILGGLELLKKVKAEEPDRPFILMTDYENKPAEQSAKEIGVNYFFYKPKSSQLDEDYSSPELLNFVAVLENALAGMPMPSAQEARKKPEQEETYNLAEELSKELEEEGFGLTMPHEDEKPSRGISMLKAMINELNDPSSSGQITLLVLRFASELMNRAVIFLVARNLLAGLGQFGIELDGKDPELHVRKIRIPADEPSILQEALQKRMPLKKPLRRNKWNEYLVKSLGGMEPDEVFVAPIISSGRIAAILYGDNAPEHREIGDTESLEIFLAQAGLAMEKALLERRLSELKKG